VLAEPRLRRVESAFFAFGAAEYGVWVAILVYAYERGGATLAGVIAVVQLIPAAVVAPLATRTAERLSRGAALHLGYGTLAISLSATAAVLLLKAPAPIVYAGAAVAASAVTLIRPAQSALLPDLVGEPADLTAANVITGWVESGSLLIGPAIAGLMIGFDGPGAAVALFAAAIVLATILVAPLGGRSRETKFEAEQADDAGTVLAQLRGDSAVTLLLALVGVQFVALRRGSACSGWPSARSPSRRSSTPAARRPHCARSAGC
jgi:MFS family permease